MALKSKQGFIMEKKFCSQCNNQVIKSLMFCPKCGSLNFTSQPTFNNNAQFNSNPTAPTFNQNSNYFNQTKQILKISR